MVAPLQILCLESGHSRTPQSRELMLSISYAELGHAGRSALGATVSATPASTSVFMSFRQSPSRVQPPIRLPGVERCRHGRAVPSQPEKRERFMVVGPASPDTCRAHKNIAIRQSSNRTRSASDCACAVERGRDAHCAEPPRPDRISTTMHLTCPIEGAEHWLIFARKHHKKVSRKCSIRVGQAD